MPDDDAQDELLIERLDDVLVITLNRPDARNAVDPATARRLAAEFVRFDEDDSLKVAVFAGAHGTFCAGADLKVVQTGSFDAIVPEAPIDRHDTRAPMGPTYLRLDKPVIGAISGYAVAGGLELSLWCDLRVVEEDAVLGVFCRRWGVPLIDGGTVRLPRLIGHSRALDLILTGRPVAADEAERMGLANRVVPTGTAREAAIELARDLTRFPQTCMLNDRRSSYDQWDLDFDEAMVNEARIGRETFRSGETAAGAARFASGRGRGGDFTDL
ncbi:MAG: crotonase/enoyl-CoA hydratase family protein [Actinomycetota bacterium]